MYFLILHKALQVAPGQACCHGCHGQGGDGSSARSTEGRQQITPCNPANGAHLLLKLTLACLFSPGASAIHPGMRAMPSVVTSTYRPVGCAPRSRVCSPPKVGLLLCDADTWHLLQVKTYSQNHRFFHESPDDLNRHCYF